MKLNKIISSVLVLVMLFASFCVVVPVSAAEEAKKQDIKIMDSESVLTDLASIQAILQDYKGYIFETPYDMLQYELEKNYLDYLKYGDRTVYVNRYTGVMYYVNETTGQIITSNPIDLGKSEGIDTNFFSQIELEYFTTTDVSSGNYNSFSWINTGSFISVSSYGENGIAVEYALGPVGNSYIAPTAMLYETAKEEIFLPAFQKIATVLEEKCGAFDSGNASGLSITSYDITEQKIYGNGDYYKFTNVKNVLNEYITYAERALTADSSDYQGVKNLIDSVIDIFSQYVTITPEDAKTNTLYKEKITALQDDQTVILINGAIDTAIKGSILRRIEKAIRASVPDYTLEMARLHEQECGFEAEESTEASFKISICYSIDEDGSLMVEVPSNLITFNESLFAIKNISVLKYFGVAGIASKGYIFYPDGSGAIADFDDFGSASGNNMSTFIDSLIYGYDYSYSELTIYNQKKHAHREQITMPVYGMVNETNANDLGASQAYEKVTNGFFAIIEEGSSLCELNYFFGRKEPYITVYSRYSPNPSDTYDLSQSISVSGLGSYTVVAPASYAGSLKTRYTMLTDSGILASLDGYAGYETSYIGMVNYYRDYLEKLGVIEPIGEVLEDLPLYIEALGSISITKKILSFPVTTSIPLTTFDDVAMMYKDLSNAYQKILDKAAEHQKTADDLKADDEAKHADEIERNLALVEKYNALAEKIEGVSIKNINFRLTGFTNGGMHFTYPTKVNWERSTGGKTGLNELIGIAKDANKDENANFGLYPDFDFMYINNTSAFDNINAKKTAACMVDNRYASKQVYNSVQQGFESIFALVVSTSTLDMLYTKFLKQYSKYDFEGISVSTLGSDLNSNFNVDDPVAREDSITNVKSLLAKMSTSYSVMSDKGNIYAVEYLDHILTAPIDSSHFNNASYSIPFFGMVLHGYVNYAGTPINYSGSPG